MRILRIISSISKKAGGPQNGIYYLSPILKENGIDTSIITLENDKKSSTAFDQIYAFRSITNYKFSFKALFSIFSLNIISQNMI